MLCQRYAAKLRNNNYEENKMKVGLKLSEQFTVSKHNIVHVITFESDFHIALSDNSLMVVAKEENDNSGYYDNEEFVGYVVEVSINEYHRIQRELSEYFEVEIKDLECEQHELT
ncbi:hypothetical protein A6E03_19680 [Aliivibrio sp. 1S128]|nr:hypothetical protein A6E03_19680 [Aliivibrio sp. 1S128]